MDDAEILIKDHITPLKEHATRLIRSHRFVIPQLEKYAGIKEANQAAIRDAITRVGTTEMEGFGSRDLEDGGEEGEEG